MSKLKFERMKSHAEWGMIRENFYNALPSEDNIPLPERWPFDVLFVSTFFDDLLQGRKNSAALQDLLWSPC